MPPTARRVCCREGVLNVCGYETVRVFESSAIFYTKQSKKIINLEDEI